MNSPQYEWMTWVSAALIFVVVCNFTRFGIMRQKQKQSGQPPTSQQNHQDQSVVVIHLLYSVCMLTGGLYHASAKSAIVYQTAYLVSFSLAYGCLLNYIVLRSRQFIDGSKLECLYDRNLDLMPIIASIWILFGILKDLYRDKVYLFAISCLSMALACLFIGNVYLILLVQINGCMHSAQLSMSQQSLVKQVDHRCAQYIRAILSTTVIAIISAMLVEINLPLAASCACLIISNLSFISSSILIVMMEQQTPDQVIIHGKTMTDYSAVMSTNQVASNTISEPTSTPAGTSTLIRPKVAQNDEVV
ncbi:hypothetical protein MIR68_012123 [Amoeboaphelidium protococcarum]|nr:hypothetical protein MIR68_012123 [Amoeboaphelidium protococcarum]